MDLPRCGGCGEEIARRDGVWQLTDAPDMVLEGDAPYIGYEHIGAAYSGGRRHLIEEKDDAVAAEIARLTGAGIFLDIGCGDGCLTVPAAGRGVRILAADIANGMLRILREKAARNAVGLERVTLCRMNALSLPLGDGRIDVAVCNGVLHLIGEPARVVGEIHRVLRPGGCFVCLDDRPGAADDSPFDNQRYNDAVAYLYGAYWAHLNARGIQARRYSWRFDRKAACGALFGGREERVIPRGGVYERRLEEGFLPRFTGRGFSDQTAVPEALHREAADCALAEAAGRFGGAFGGLTYRGREADILMTIFKK